MCYWNPLNKPVLYFHVCRKNDDYYLKVDVINRRVYKCSYLCNDSIYKFYKIGLYELKWSTFVTGHCWNLKPSNIKLLKKFEANDGSPRTRVKHTTEEQWNNAIEILLNNINKKQWKQSNYSAQ